MPSTVDKSSGVWGGSFFSSLGVQWGWDGAATLVSYHLPRCQMSSVDRSRRGWGGPHPGPRVLCLVPFACFWANDRAKNFWSWLPFTCLTVAVRPSGIEEDGRALEPVGTWDGPPAGPGGLEEFPGALHGWASNALLVSCGDPRGSAARAPLCPLYAWRTCTRNFTSWRFYLPKWGYDDLQLFHSSIHLGYTYSSIHIDQIHYF